MSEIDPITGLPKELGVWESITKENQRIVISMEKKKFGKPYTVIEGIDARELNIKDIAKKLKNQFACGGTAKDNRIELQGDHKAKVRERLIAMGFAAESIDVK